MVAIMDTNLDSSNIHNFVDLGAEDSMECASDCFAHPNDEMQKETGTIRSVAMSANIACTVKDEVKHLIRVNTFESPVQKGSNLGTTEEGRGSNTSPIVRKSDRNVKSSRATLSSCSHVLPADKENIISSIVLSKWDDIMGPQTVHVWLPELKYTKIKSVSDRREASDSKSVGQIVCAHDDREWNINIMKAIKYVTSHTVNYTGVSLSSSNVIHEERDSNLFVVPDLEIVTQSLVLHVHSASVIVPFSLALVVHLEQYEYFLHLRRMCHQWLRRMAARLVGVLFKYLSSSGGLENSSIAILNHWVMDLCHTVFSLGVCGLGTATLACSADILSHPLLERALTSHLQTFGCTVVMGTSPMDINSMISLLALFIDTDERFCSRLVLPAMKYSFHVGLFLQTPEEDDDHSFSPPNRVQGLLLDEFGCRELSSVELAANPYLVTAVDLTRGVHPSAVKQTPPRHLQRGDWEEQGEGSLHRSILHPVKESAYLVKTLLNGMKQLPPDNWQSFINIFLKKVSSLADTLLSIIHYLREDSLHRSITGGGTLSRHLMWSLSLHEGDFLIVLAAAEKLKPGVYSYIMGLDASHR